MTAGSRDNWKEKYLSSLDRLERQQRQLEGIDGLMRDAIARLCVIAEGQNRNLDDQLEKLRRAVRGGLEPDAIRQLLESVAHIARSLDDRPTGKLAAVPQRDQPVAPTAQADVPGAVNVSVPAMAGQSAIAGEVPSGCPPLAALVAELRLPSVQTDARLRELAEEVARANIDAELRALARRIAGVINSTLTDLTTTRADVHVDTADLLIQLLNCIAVPIELAPRMESVKARLTIRPAVRDWPEVLHDIAGLIAEMRARIEAEKSELESFLVQLTDRLRDLEEHLQDAQSAGRQSFDGGQQLEKRMRDEMGRIETSVHQSSSIEQLKSAVRERVDVIRIQLEEHRRSDARRQAEFEQRLEHMTTRLRAVEQETTHLRAHLRKRKIQAMSDPLTGVPNRAAFEERLAREYGRWKRYQHPLGFMILDVDHFKQINDSYGHKAGDRALKLIAQVLRASLRETDFIARYGGEEFVALLPETGLQQAGEVAEKLRRAIEACSFHHRGVRVPITLSIGYCEFSDDDTSEAVFQRADSALYRAKADGRNRCNRGVDGETDRITGMADRR